MKEKSAKRSNDRRRHQSKKQKLFDPDTIATAIHQALRLDLQPAIQEYGSLECPGRMALVRQSEELMKKFCTQNQDKPALEAQAFDKFRQINEHMAKIGIELDSLLSGYNTSRLQSSTPRMEKIHKRARALMHSVLGSLDIDEWFSACKNSQGSSVGVPFTDTSNEKKFTFPMTVTKKALNIFSQAMAHDPRLCEAVNNFNSSNPVTGPWKIVDGSRATTVDKTSTVRRFIAVEPTCNMYLQQGLMHLMYQCMKAVGLDVEVLPEIHKMLAKASSITCRNATIDWSSASDCVSIRLLRWLLPPSWFEAVILTRSNSTTLNGEPVELAMIATMGNATTFPLETLVFWTYAHAVLLSQDDSYNGLFPEWEDLNRVSVFGDDCIVPTHIANEFISVMESVGFIVNKEKSFYGTEQFRESCGGDYSAGYDVRPYNLRAPHSNSFSALEPWLYIIGNSLFKKYISYFGELSYVYNREFFKLYFSLFREYKLNVKLVPPYYPDDAGLKISEDILRIHRLYDVKLDTIKRTHQGTYSFKFCSFRYRNERKKDDGIAYALWLKFQSALREADSPLLRRNAYLPDMRWSLVDPPKSVYKIRRVGGYVVAKGATCHWHVPEINSAA